MSMTSQQLIERATKRFPQVDLELRSRLYVLIPDALKSLGYQVMNSNDPMVKQKLIKDFTVTASAGTASLTTPLTASEPMILESLKSATMTHSTSDYPFQHLFDRQSLVLDRPSFGLIYDWVNGNTLRTRDTDGSLTALSGTVTISANYVPILTTVSGDQTLEEMLVEELVRVASTGIGAQMPQEAQVAA